MEGDTEVATHDWLSAFVEQAQRPTVGAVGPLILSGDGTVRQAGLILGTDDAIVSGHRAFPRDAFGYFSTLRSINNFSALPGTCLMMRREVFRRAGGFDEQFAMGYGDVDLCLRLRRAGYDNVFIPHVIVYALAQERSAKGSLKPFGPDLELMRTRWRGLEAEDPCYNPNLGFEKGGYALRI